jgi:diaminopimelate epimerase
MCLYIGRAYMKFTKMHGLGNDYIYINCFKEKVENPPEVSRVLSDRHFGVGSDGLVLILPSGIADFRMRMFNPDGSEAEMCGNAIRCVGKYVYDNGMTDKTTVTIETLAGIKVLNMHVNNGRVETVRVDMGEPVLDPQKIPVDSDKGSFIAEPVIVGDTAYTITCVSMGNPHAVTYVDKLDGFPLEKIGPLVENHPMFPKRTNVEFARALDKKTVAMRVWERGTGETLACGTGACAVLVSSVLNGLTERAATVKLLGGDLFIEWSGQDNHIYMTGPATRVFEGEAFIDDIGLIERGF